MPERMLAISHDAFSGTAADFIKLRQIVALAIGGSYPPHWVYDETGKPILQGGTGEPLIQHEYDPNAWVWGDGYNWDSNPGLGAFFACDERNAALGPETCRALADELDMLLPEIERAAPPERTEFPGRAGSYPEAVRWFIHGCRRAVEASEPLVFG